MWLHSLKILPDAGSARMSHPDLFDSREPLGKPFAGSLAMHAAVGGALLFVWFFHPSVETFGDKQQSSGSVGVSVVKTIPIPAKEGRVNPVANDTQSIVPQAPPKKKEVVKAPPPDPKAWPDDLEGSQGRPRHRVPRTARGRHARSRP